MGEREGMNETERGVVETEREKRADILYKCTLMLCLTLKREKHIPSSFSFSHCSCACVYVCVKV